MIFDKSFASRQEVKPYSSTLVPWDVSEVRISRCNSPIPSMKLFLHCILYSSIVTGLLSAVTTSTPSLTPSVKPTFKPSSKPFSKPSLKPRSKTTNQPTAYPSSLPSSVPTSFPTSMPTSVPTSELGGGTITSVPFSDDFSYSTIPYPTSPPIDVGKVPESGYGLSGKLMYDASEAYSRHLCPL